MSAQVSLETLSHQFRLTQKLLSKEINIFQADACSPDKWASDLLRIQNLVQIVESSANREKLTLASLEARINDSSSDENVSQKSHKVV
jgi:hypothetical protein